MRSDTPRYTKRSWQPRTDFERRYSERRTPVAELLDGIPESLWDTPHMALEYLSPREAAEHATTSNCRACWTGLQNLKAIHQ